MINDKVPCEACGGTGYKSKNDGWVCPACKGDKVRPITTEDLRESHIAGQNKARFGIRDVNFADQWLKTRYGIGEGRVDRTPEDI